MNSWENRWTTFKNFKNSEFARKLCSAGFFYHKEDNTIICGFCHIEIKNVRDSIEPEKLHESISPKCPLHMVAYEKRLETFQGNWTNKISKTALARSGFFKVNSDTLDDEVACFSCGLVMAAWDGNEDPYLEHRKARPDCKYVPPELEKNESDNSCSVCMAESRNVCFVPCGHVATCVDCANKILSSCPMCNENFERKLKIYW